jgi:ABC-type sugar transport system permease subunit
VATQLETATETKKERASRGAHVRVSWPRRRRDLWGYVYVAPAVFLVIAFIGYPLGSVVYHAFTAWDGISPPVWVGLKNFSRLLHDPIFHTAIKNNVLFAISVPIETTGALILAHLIHQRVPLWRFFRSTFFLPAVYSTVVVGIITSVALLPQGPLNEILHGVRLSALRHNWLEQTNTAIGAIILVVIWANIGYSVLIYLAGMSSLDPQMEEAARLDGAGFWGILWKVNAPNLRRVIELVVVINTITAFAYMLPYIYTITQGGPGFSTFATEFDIYYTGFTGQQLGYASAMGVVLAAIMLVIGAFQVRILTRGGRL